MQYKDIEIGAIYKTKKGAEHAPNTEVIVIDKGQFEHTNQNDTAHEVIWKGLRFQVGRSWYRRTDDRKRIVVLDIRREQVKALSSVSLIEPLDDATVYGLCLNRVVNEESTRLRAQLNAQQFAFKYALTQLLLEITGSDKRPDYREEGNPFFILMRRPDFVKSLLSLWLKYLQTQGIQVADRDSVDVLAELEDVTLGLHQTEQRKGRLNDDVAKAAADRLGKTFDTPIQVVEV